MYAKTKISKGYQVVVPAEIRNNLKLKPGDFVTWRSTKDGILIEPLKDIKFEDICGIIVTDVKTDAVKLKKMAQQGEKITPERLREVFGEKLKDSKE